MARTLYLDGSLVEIQQGNIKTANSVLRLASFLAKHWGITTQHRAFKMTIDLIMGKKVRPCQIKYGYKVVDDTATLDRVFYRLGRILKRGFTNGNNYRYADEMYVYLYEGDAPIPPTPPRWVDKGPTPSNPWYDYED